MTPKRPITNPIGWTPGKSKRRKPKGKSRIQIESDLDI
jgi:hypothetical protein